ncbi:pseudouridine synthase [Acidovorax sp. GBBC 3334]|nr:pseudouridine synthase [Acidovorax sp. GBBC 3334]MDA8455346.1 pseudouridine synthase [Acidovorax sp. GBBC 3334]
MTTPLPDRHPPLPILWHDDDLVAVYKPAGWLVHRTGLDAGETRFVMQALRDQLGRHVYPVHRLDKGTCGVLVMALHADAARALSQAFEHHRVRKRYLALVRGHPPATARVDHALRPDDAPPDAPAQPARTSLRCIARLERPEPSDARFATTRAALVEAWPETGRRHQIRRHLKHIAHPILGDATHGKGPLNRWWAERLGLQRLWLHAWQLALPHPATGQPLVLDSGLHHPVLDSGLHHPVLDGVSAPAGHGIPDLGDWLERVLPMEWQRGSGPEN